MRGFGRFFLGLLVVACLAAPSAFAGPTVVAQLPSVQVGRALSHSARVPQVVAGTSLGDLTRRLQIASLRDRREALRACVGPSEDCTEIQALGAGGGPTVIQACEKQPDAVRQPGEQSEPNRPRSASRQIEPNLIKPRDDVCRRGTV